MKIAVIGSAPSSVTLAPFQDASYSEFLGGTPPPQYPPSEFINDAWQIWACSPGAFGVAPRADRWFELHRWEPGKPWFSPQYVQFLREFRGPVYTGGPVPELANGVVYPLAEIEAEFSSYFLNSSLSLMMALAIVEIEQARAAEAPGIATADSRQAWLTAREDTIGLWGVDMAANEEWASQRPGCHFFILEALRRGIGIQVPKESCLLRPMPVYGISEWDHNYVKATARMRELTAEQAQLEQQAAQATQRVQYIAGARDNMNYMINTWMSPYGIPAGCRIEIQPGTGLGGGTTMQTPPAIEQPAYTATECVRDRETGFRTLADELARARSSTAPD